MYGSRLRKLRKERRWTLEEVAKKIEMGTSTYAGYETEYRQPPIEKLIKLSNLYDVSVDYVLGLTDDREKLNVDRNARKYLKENQLHWDGVPLNDEELKPIRELLEVVVRDRLPKFLEDKKKKEEQKKERES